jgi:hypothetical protein
MALAANMAGRLLGFVKPIHRKYRGQKVELFLRLIRECGRGGRLLDVGGAPGIEGEFLELYAAFDEVVVVNLEVTEVKAPVGVTVKTMAADALGIFQCGDRARGRLEPPGAVRERDTAGRFARVLCDYAE